MDAAGKCIKVVGVYAVSREYHAAVADAATERVGIDLDASAASGNRAVSGYPDAAGDNTFIDKDADAEGAESVPLLTIAHPEPSQLRGSISAQMPA